MSGTGTQEKANDVQAQSAQAENFAENDSNTSGKKSDTKEVLTRLISNPIIQTFLLVGLCLACFGRTLGSYFLADDIGEVRYIWQIFNNNQWDLFWSNFTGNYMQVPNMAVYRPILMLSLVIDFLIWKGNAFGYYLTNLLCFTGSTILLYTFIRQLTAEWGRVRSSAASFFGAALFTATPLHCESISWVVGRVDSQCCLFYLAALNCFLLSRSKKTKLLTAAGILLFFLAMGTKEMAIGFAPTLMAIEFLWNRSAESQASAEDQFEAGKKTNLSAAISQFKQNALAAWKFSSAAWAATAAYFVIRWLALGTLLGGYAGSVGASQSANAISKWLDGDSWRRLVLPFSSEVFSAGSNNETMLFACYCALLGIIFVRALAGSLPWKWILFLAFWALTQLAPIYRLFGIGVNLEGARFCFFFSMSFSVLLPILLFSPEKKESSPLANRLAILSSALLLAATFVLAKTAYASNIVWLHAGKEVRSVLQDAQQLASNAKDGSKFALLGIPKEHGGAHMILNGSTFEMLMSPPFSDKNYSESFITFDPMLFGDDTAINGSRFRQVISSNEVKGPYVWNGAAKKFELVAIEAKASSLALKPEVIETQAFSLLHNNNSNRSTLSVTAQSNSSIQKTQILPFVADHAIFTSSANGFEIQNPNAGDGVLLSDLRLNPLGVGYVRLHLSSSSDLTKLPFELRWKSADSQDHNRATKWSDDNTVRVYGTDLVASSEQAGSLRAQSVTFPVGRKWRWYSSSNIDDIAIVVPPLKDVVIEKVELLDASELAPTLSIRAKPCANSGAYFTTEAVSILMTPAKQASNNTPKYLVQVSKNNHFFENFNKADENLAVAQSFQTEKSEFMVRPEQLEGSGYYQVRVCNLDSAGKQISDFSDPITILLQENSSKNKPSK